MGRRRIAIEELLEQYAAGERNFARREINYCDEGLSGCHLAG